MQSNQTGTHIAIADLVLTLAKAWQNRVFDERDAYTWVLAETELAATSFHHQSEWLGLAIRDDDLKVIEATVAGVSAAAGSKLFGGDDQTIVTVAALACAVLVMIWSIHKKAARLSPLQSRLLAILRSCDGVTPDELLEIAAQSGDTYSLVWTKPIVDEILDSLSCVRLRDGTTVSLVTCDREMKWAAAGI